MRCQTERRDGLFCLQAGAQPGVPVFTLLEDEGLLCDFCDDFWAVDTNVPSKADFKPSLWSLVVTAWGDMCTVISASWQDLALVPLL